MRSRHPIQWSAAPGTSAHPLARREPRNGARAILRATVGSPEGPLLLYCLHLEVFCGILDRMVQFGDALADVKAALAGGGPTRVALLGDLNTMAHGVARLSPHYCCDYMRFWSLGQYEAQVWHRQLLSVPDPHFAPEHDHARGGPPLPAPLLPQGPADGGSDGAAAAPAAVAAAAAMGGVPAVGGAGQQVPLRGAAVNPHLLRHGFSRELCAVLTNPGLADPFCPVADATLDNPAYRLLGRSLMKGKLDWVLLRRLAVAAKMVGNNDYALSDHKWLAVDVHFM